MSDSRASAGAEKGAAASAEAAADQAVFYRYRDISGRVVIVDSITAVPTSARSTVEAIVPPPPPATPLAALPETLARDLHLPSFAAGAVAGLIAAVLLFVLLRVKTMLVRVVLLGVLAAAGGGLYLGWVRRTAGQGGALVASPAALIDDARSAVQKMNERAREQQRVLEEIQSER